MSEILYKLPSKNCWKVFDAGGPIFIGARPHILYAQFTDEEIDSIIERKAWDELTSKPPINK